MRRLPFLLLMTLPFAGCADPCSNTIVSEIRDPASDAHAVMFQRSCGATTGFSTQVNVSRDEEVPSGGGNAFRADGDHGAAPLGNWGGPWAEMKWIGPEKLLIRYAAGSRIFEEDNAVSGVRITYEVVSR